jgi:gluconate kinase
MHPRSQRRRSGHGPVAIAGATARSMARMDEASRDPVLILTGTPGTGKTSVARILTQRFDLAVHVEGDRFFHFIERGYIEPWKPSSHDQNMVVMQSIATAAASYADGAYFTIIDAIVSPRWFLEPIRDWLRAGGHHVAYAVLRAPLGVCVSRCAARRGGELREPKVIEQLWHDFADLGAFDRHAIEAGGSIGETAAVIAERLCDGTLTLDPARPRT